MSFIDLSTLEATSLLRGRSRTSATSRESRGSKGSIASSSPRSFNGSRFSSFEKRTDEALSNDGVSRSEYSRVNACIDISY